MQRRDLPDRWVTRLERYTDEQYGTDYRHRGKLGASDFPLDSVLRITFADGSSASFRFAFHIEAPEWHEVAVFTEHCGYHIFPLADLAIERVHGHERYRDEE